MPELSCAAISCACGAIAILDIGGVDGDADQQAGSISHDMALAALDLLGRIVAARPATFADVQWGILIEAARLVFTSVRFATPPGAGLAGGGKWIRTIGPPSRDCSRSGRFAQRS